jgi:hypothetical protein
MPSTEALNVTYLVPFAGNRMMPSHGSNPAIHLLRLETARGTETWCGLTVRSGRHEYNHRERLKADEQSLVHAACLTAYEESPSA